MGKSTKMKAPGIASGTFSISGGPSAKYRAGNTSYKLNSAQQSAYDYAQNAFAEGLKGLNVFSPETMNQLNSEVNAYKQNALSQLDSIYTPMLESTRNDAARRFGNLDNSVFLKNLDAIENKRAQAVSDLSQDVAAKQSSLISQELANRYNFLNFLNSYQNQVFNNALGATGMANASANQYQNALNNAYSAQLNQSSLYQNAMKLALQAALLTKSE